MEQHPFSEQAPAEKDSIFSGDEFSTEIYQKHIRAARTAIFVAAGLLLLSVIILRATADPLELEYIWIDYMIWGIFIGAFVALGFWTKKKPYTAIICALVLYGILIALNGYLDPTTLYKGIFIKIFIVGSLIKGIKDAKEAQQMQELAR